MLGVGLGIANVAMLLNLGVALPPILPPPTGEAKTFGADTPIGMGGLPTKAPDGVYGQFTAEAGILTPNVSPLDPGQVIIAGEKIIVSRMGDRDVTVASGGELRTLLDAASPAALSNAETPDVTVRIRSHVTIDSGTLSHLGGGSGGRPSPVLYHGTLTLRGEGSGMDRPTLLGWGPINLDGSADRNGIATENVQLRPANDDDFYTVRLAAMGDNLQIAFRDFDIGGAHTLDPMGDYGAKLDYSGLAGTFREGERIQTAEWPAKDARHIIAVRDNGDGTGTLVIDDGNRGNTQNVNKARKASKGVTIIGENSGATATISRTAYSTMPAVAGGFSITGLSKPGHVVLERGYGHDLSDPFKVMATRSITVRDCEGERYIADCYKMNPNTSATGVDLTFERNKARHPISKSSDLGNPHADGFQIHSNGSATPYGHVKFTQNQFMDGLSRGYAQQVLIQSKACASFECWGNIVSGKRQSRAFEIFGATGAMIHNNTVFAETRADGSEYPESNQPKAWLYPPNEFRFNTFQRTQYSHSARESDNQIVQSGVISPHLAGPFYIDTWEEQFAAAAPADGSDTLAGARGTPVDWKAGTVSLIHLGTEPNTLVAAFLGQSENEIAWAKNDSASTSGPYPALLPDVDAQIALQANSDKSGTETIRMADQAAIDNREVAPGFVAMANVWHAGSGGRPLRVVDTVQPGTNAEQMLDAEHDSRDTAIDRSLIAFAETAFGPVGRLTYNWSGDEASVSKSLRDLRSPHLIGRNADGTAYDWTSGEIDHAAIDTAGQGRGLFPDGAKIDVMLPIHQIETAEAFYDPPHPNYRTRADGSEIAGVIDQNAYPAVNERKAFMEAVPEPNRGLATITPALCLFGDYDGGVQLPQPAQIASHPSLRNADGQILFGMHCGASLLVSEGHLAASRHLRTEVAPDGAHADVVFEMANGGDLTTMRRQRGEADGVFAPRPHQQFDGMGFVLYRAGDTDRTARPLYRADLTDDVLYPSAYRADVAIVDAGSNQNGVREAVVRITPNVPFAEGDTLHFGTDGGYGGFILHGHPDYDAKLYLDALIEHVPQLDAAGYPGLPIEPQVISVLSGVLEREPSGPPSDMVGGGWTRAAGSDARMTGPTLPEGTRAITVVIEADIPEQDLDGSQNLVEYDSQTFRVQLYPGPGKRTLRVLADMTGGGRDFVLANSADGTFSAGRRRIVASVDLDTDGSRTARLRTWVDGVSIIDVTDRPTGVGTDMAATRPLKVLHSPIAGKFYEVATYAGASIDGNVAGLTRLAGIGPTDDWNDPPAETGLVKEGTDTFERP